MTTELYDYNAEVDFRRYKLGFNVIPADSVNKTTWILWKNGPINWQTNSIPEELHNKWKSENAFKDGYAIIVGKCWYGENAGLYGNALDYDNIEAIYKWFTDWEGVLEAAKKTRIEWHQNKAKLHYLFYTKRPLQNRNLPIGIEVRAENELLYCGQNKDGNYWTPLVTGDITTIEENQLQKLEGIIDSLSNGKSYTTSRERNDPNYKRHEGQNRSLDLLQEMDSLLLRNNGLLDDDVIKQLAKDWHDKHCDPHYSNAKFESNWRQALDFRDRGIRDSNVKESDKKDRIQWLTHEIMQKHVFKTMRDNDDVYYYNQDKGLYVAGGERLIKELCELLDSDTSSFERQEVLNHIRLKTGVDRAEFDADPNILNLKNGLLNVLTEVFEEHSADSLSLVQLPIKYDLDARCPRIEQFLQDVLPSEEDCFTALEFVAYCLYKTAKYQKALMCVGTGANGKGTFLKLIERFVGSENTSNRSLQDICDNRFAKAALYGKLVNVFADLKADKLTRTGDFKMLVAGDSITGEHKFKNPFVFRNHAKLIFSANQIPESEDKTFAYFRRWIILFFYGVFEGANDEVNLIDELTTEEELSGLLNLSLIGLQRLMADNGFVNADDVEKVERDYEENSSGVVQFLSDRCELTMKREDYVICRDLWQQYLEYCKDKNLASKADNAFGMALAEKRVRREYLRVGKGQREYCYLGVKQK